MYREVVWSSGCEHSWIAISPDQNWGLAVCLNIILKDSHKRTYQFNWRFVVLGAIVAVRMKFRCCTWRWHFLVTGSRNTYGFSYGSGSKQANQHSLLFLIMLKTSFATSFMSSIISIRTRSPIRTISHWKVQSCSRYNIIYYRCSQTVQLVKVRVFKVFFSKNH